MLTEEPLVGVGGGGGGGGHSSWLEGWMKLAAQKHGIYIYKKVVTQRDHIQSTCPNNNINP